MKIVARRLCLLLILALITQGTVAGVHGHATAADGGPQQDPTPVTHDDGSTVANAVADSEPDCHGQRIADSGPTGAESTSPKPCERAGCAVCLCQLSQPAFLTGPSPLPTRSLRTERRTLMQQAGASRHPPPDLRPPIG